MFLLNRQLIKEKSSVIYDADRRTKRNTHIDILKGLAITCMVCAHSDCPAPYTDMIYLFHMAVFFMASGYFYNVKNSADIKAVAKYSYHKIKALYVPYVLFNGILVLLHNLCLKFMLYTSDPTFLEIGGSGAVWGLKWPYDLSFMIEVLKVVLKFQHEPQLAGATWFLRVLFEISCAHCILMWGINKIRFNTLRKIVYGVIIAGCSIAAMQVQSGVVLISENHKGIFACYLAYVLGMFIRRVEQHMRYDLTSAILCFCLLYLLKPFGSVSLNVGWITSVVFFVLCSLLGWILLRSIAEVISGRISTIFAYAGKYSMSIVFLHFLSFKLVTLFVILLRQNSMVLLASFPHLDGAADGLWIVYTFVGTCIPLVVNMLYQFCKGKLCMWKSNLWGCVLNTKGE